MDTAEQPDARIVERDDVDVMFKQVADDVPQIQEAWAEVEAAIGELRGRHFYGAVDPLKGTYLVCAVARDGDDSESLGLERGTLAGGRYARIRLKGEPPEVYDLIPTEFERLGQRPDVDPTRYWLEHYRRHDEIDLLLPITG